MLLNNYVETPAEARLKLMPLPTGELTRLSLSPSKLITYDECKQKFKQTMWKTVRGGGSIYTAIGTAAHYVVEQVNVGQKMTPDEREELFRMKLIEICSLEDIALNFPNGYKESRDVIRRYAIPDGWNLLHAESLQQLEFPKFTFRYIVDAIFVSDDGKTIYIIDYKTSASAPKSPLQLMLYAWATAVLRPEVLNHTIKSAFHMLRKDNIIFHDASRESIEATDVLVENSVNLMLKLFAADYFPTTRGPACHFCEILDCPDRDSKNDRGN